MITSHSDVQVVSKVSKSAFMTQLCPVEKMYHLFMKHILRVLPSLIDTQTN